MSISIDLKPLKATTSQGVSTTLSEDAIRTFVNRCQGITYGPYDDGYEAVRRTRLGLVDRRPALIVRCTCLADVIAAVDFACEHDVHLAVRSSGNNLAGHPPCDGGLIVDLSLCVTNQRPEYNDS